MDAAGLYFVAVMAPTNTDYFRAGNIVGGEPKVTKKQSVKKEAAAQVMKI
jgi:hypothetical protein